MCLICDRIALIRRGENPYFVREMETGYVVIGDYQHFPGYALFLCKRHETELFHLDKAFARAFMEEMITVAGAVKEAAGAEKMNYECLGQGDAHLHWHLFPRKFGDLGEYGVKGNGPVWWIPREKMWAEDVMTKGAELEELKSRLLKELDELCAAHVHENKI